jgi:excisionase family DNA binding protein
MIVTSLPIDDQRALFVHLQSLFVEYHQSLLTATDVAQQLEVPKDAVYRWRKEGRLDAVPLGCRCIRFSPDEVARFEASRPARSNDKR